MDKLHQRIREARRLTGLSQQALALELDVTRSAITQWEMAKGTSPSVENLIALARRSRMSFEYLATGRGAKVLDAPASKVAEESPPYAGLSDEQRRLLACFDRLSVRQRAGSMDLLGAGRR